MNFILFVIFGYFWEVFSQFVEVMIMKRFDKTQVTASNTLLISFVGYMIFVTGLLFLMKILQIHI